MDWQIILSILAGSLVVLALLFLSLIHLFMIPKDVMDRDTGKLKERQAADAMSRDRDIEREKPEVPEVPPREPELPGVPPAPQPETPPAVPPKPEEPRPTPQPEPEMRS